MSYIRWSVRGAAAVCSTEGKNNHRMVGLCGYFLVPVAAVKAGTVAETSG